MFQVVVGGKCCDGVMPGVDGSGVLYSPAVVTAGGGDPAGGGSRGGRGGRGGVSELVGSVKEDTVVGIGSGCQPNGHFNIMSGYLLAYFHSLFYLFAIS